MGFIGPVSGGGKPAWRLGENDGGGSKVKGGGEGLGGLCSFADGGRYAVHDELAPSAVGSQGGGFDEEALQSVLDFQLVFGGIGSRYRRGGKEDDIPLVGCRCGQENKLVAGNR